LDSRQATQKNDGYSGPVAMENDQDSRKPLNNREKELTVIPT
jgi:hypothetical protein